MEMMFHDAPTMADPQQQQQPSSSRGERIPLVRKEDSQQQQQQQQQQYPSYRKRHRNKFWCFPGKTTEHVWPEIPEDRENCYNTNSTSNRHAYVSKPWCPSLTAVRKRCFLILTEPESSVASLVFYFILISAIFGSNLLMIMQTMDMFQFTPTDCHTCGGSVSYLFDDDVFIDESPGGQCVCPPAPFPFTTRFLEYLLYFLTIEWCFRITLFFSPDPAPTQWGRLCQWISFLTSGSTLIDALGIFPFYIEEMPTTLVSLRMIRLFRIFQLVRLGQYNNMFMSLTNVLKKSFQYLRLLLLILAFGATFFGSMVYWLEKGSWKYHEPTGEHRFVRIGVDGEEEPTPFGSIPIAFWWYLVTATTVGYGDLYPTSTAGKWVAMFAMLMGVLVIAFPVSVFSDLWSNELKKVKGFEFLQEDDDDDDDDDVDFNKNDNNNGNRKEATMVRQGDSGEPMEYHSTSMRRQLENPTSSNVVMMDQQDLQNILECLHNIQQNERELRSILRKYHHFEHRHDSMR